MNKTAFLAMSFAALFFCVLAGLNHFTSQDSQNNNVGLKFKTTNNTAKTSQQTNPTPLKETLRPIDPSEHGMAKASYEQFLSSPPMYLQGTDIRGHFYVDEEGELIITASIKQRFDYFFLMTEHIPLTDIINVIHGHLISELSGAALVTAKIVLEDYVNYFKQYNELMNNHVPKDNSNAYELAEEIAQLRIDILGYEVSEIFFKNSQALQAQNLKRLAIKNQQHQYSSPLDLPANLQKSQQATLGYVLSKQTLEKAQEAGANDQELNSLRTELYGEAAALRLQELDKQREQWSQYLSNYQELNKLLLQTGITEQQISSQLNATFAQEYNLTKTQINLLAAQTRMANIKK